MIGIVAPEAAAGLASEVESRLRRAGLEPWRAGELQAPLWSLTEILVNVAVPCGAAEMDRAPRLRAIVSPLLGYDFIDLAEATRRGVAVVNGEVPENRESMAEATIMLMLALLYRLDEAQRALRAPGPSPLRRGRMLKGKTVGVVGLGGLSRALITRLEAWGCEILVSSRSGAAPAGARAEPLDTLLAASDIVVVATSLDHETHHLLNGERLSRLKPDALLVNTARGAIVDETALVRLLSEGRIGGAALDVFEVEPLHANHPLRALPNVILTPHAIGHTVESGAAVPARAVENVLALCDGRLPESCRNPQVAVAWTAPPPASR